jgi:hypothetical protein
MDLDNDRSTIWDSIWWIVRETPLRIGFGGPQFVEKKYYREDSINQMYIPEYTIERSGEKLFELLKWSEIRFNERIDPCDNHDLIRREHAYIAFIKYKIDSTWYRRIVSLIDSVHGDGAGNRFIVRLWLRNQLQVLDSEMAATLIKLIAEWNDWKIRDTVLRDIIRLACGFNLDLDGCLQTVYGIDSSYIHEINKYIMNYRLDSKIRPDWEDEGIKRHGEKIMFRDGKTCKIYDMKHQILLF